MNETQRGTGRTTRMLDYALSRARAGKYVFVICATKADADRLQSIIAQAIGGEARGMKVYSDAFAPGGQLSFETCENRMWEWGRMAMLGSRPECESDRALSRGGG